MNEQNKDSLPVGVPDGWRVMQPTSTILSAGDRWEIYAPCGSGGIVNEDDVTDWVVRQLLDAMAAPTVKAEQAQATSLPAAGSAELPEPDFALDGGSLQCYYAETVQRIVAALSAQQSDPWAPSGADYDRAIHRNPDAKAWADFFVATFPGLADKHELMIGWFANAMMAMHDYLKAQQSAPERVSVPRDLLADLISSDHDTKIQAERALYALLASHAEGGEV